MRKIHLEELTDKPGVDKAQLILVEENKICDGCDSPNVKCASIKPLGCNHVMIICQDCVEGILESLDPSIIREQKLNKLFED